MQVITHKSPGGKLLRLKANVINKKLVAPQLSGDFFLMPPEKISALEDAMEGFIITQTEELREVLEFVLKRDNIRMQGITVQDIVESVKQLGEKQ